MEWNNKFSYPKSTRSIISGSRHYSLDGSNLPSVTTILKATQSEEDKAAIAAWKERVGYAEAERIKNEASSRGNSMHSFIEQFLLKNYNWMFLLNSYNLIFVFLPIIVIGGYFYKKYKNKKLLKKWEIEELLEDLHQYEEPN